MKSAAPPTASAKEPGLRFPGLATTNNEFDQFLHRILGYKAHRDGPDWVVPASDRALRAGPRDTLKLHHEIRLDEGEPLPQLADALIRLVPSVYDKYQPKVPNEITVAAGYGILSEVDELTSRLAICPKSELSALIASRILPFMMSEMKATRVAAITVDADYQQALLSLPKIALLASRHGVARSQELVLKRHALRHVLPNPLSVLDYPAIFTVFSPLAMTLPLWRYGCVWHFYKEGHWDFPHAAGETFLSQFQVSHHPMSNHSGLPTFGAIAAVSLSDMWSYLRLIVRGINDLLRFFNNPLNFRMPNGEADFGKQIQALSAISLLFADLRGMNFSVDTHNRVTYANAAMDKLANLRWQMSGRPKGKESTIAQRLASLAQSKHLRRIFRHKVAPVFPTIMPILRSETRAFVRCHQHLHDELGPAVGRMESMRLLRLRAHRNLNHGTFLSGEQFENLFLESPGRIPPWYPALPLLLVLGFMLDPKAFLTFEPYVKAD